MLSDRFERRDTRHFWAIYAALFVALIALVIWPNGAGIYRGSQIDEDRYYVGVPDWPFERIRAEMDALDSHEPGVTPQEYYETLKRVYALPPICSKMLRTHVAIGGSYPHAPELQQRDVILRNCQLFSGGFGPLTMIQQAYFEKFGQRAVAEAGEEFRNSHTGIYEPYPRPESSYSIWPFLLRMYLGSLPLALFFFLVRLKHAELRIWPEVARLWPLPRAVIYWPCMLFFYPDTDVQSQIAAARVAVRRYATALASFALSLFAGGVASAQSKTPDNSKKDPKARWTLATDLRMGVPVAVGPDPNGVLRMTLTSPGGSFLESFTSERPGYWNTSLVAGAPIVSRPGVAVNAVAGGIADSTGAFSVQAGMQLFTVRPRFYQFMPVLAVEQQVLPVSRTTLAYAGQTGIVLSPQWRLGTDAILRIPIGGKPFWLVGPHLARAVSGGFVEGAVLRDSTGATTVRARWVRTTTPTSTPGSSSWSTTLYGGYANRYVGVLGMVIHDDTVIRQGVHLTHRSGVYLDAWNSVSPDGFNNNWGDETDLTIGRAGRIGRLAVDAGLIHFMVHPLDRIRGDLRDAYLDVSLDHPVQPFVRMDWVVPRDPEVLEGGLAWRAGIRPTFTVGRPFNVEVSAAGHDGIVGNRPERVSSVRAVLKAPWSFGKLALTPFAGVQRTARPNGLAPNRTWFGLDLAYSF